MAISMTTFPKSYVPPIGIASKAHPRQGKIERIAGKEILNQKEELPFTDLNQKEITVIKNQKPLTEYSLEELRNFLKEGGDPHQIVEKQKCSLFEYVVKCKPAQWTKVVISSKNIDLDKTFRDGCSFIDYILQYSRQEYYPIAYQTMEFLEKYGVKVAVMTGNTEAISIARNYEIKTWREFNYLGKTYHTFIYTKCPNMRKELLCDIEGVKRDGLKCGLITNNSKLICYALKVGANVYKEFKDLNGHRYKPLEYVFIKGKEKFLDLFFTYGIKIDKKNLIKLDHNGHVDEVLKILDSMASSHSVRLYLVAYFGCIVTFRALIEKREKAFNEGSIEWNILKRIARLNKGIGGAFTLFQRKRKFKEVHLEKYRDAQSKPYFLLKKELRQGIEKISFCDPFFKALGELKEEVSKLPFGCQTAFYQSMRALTPPYTFLGKVKKASLRIEIEAKIAVIDKMIELAKENKALIKHTKELKGIYSHFIKDTDNNTAFQCPQSRLNYDQTAILYSTHCNPRCMKIDTLTRISHQTLGKQMFQAFPESGEKCELRRCDGVYLKKIPLGKCDLSRRAMLRTWGDLMSKVRRPEQVIRVDIKGVKSLYIASNRVREESLGFIIKHFPNLIDKINSWDVAAAFMATLIALPQSVTLDHYTVKRLVNNKGEVVTVKLEAIDYDDTSFTECHVIKNGFWLLSALMDKPIDREFHSYFCSKLPQKWVEEWLNSLRIENGKYKDLEEHGITKKTERETLKLPMTIPHDLHTRLCQKIGKIQKALKKDENITPRKLLRAIEPELSSAYEKIRKKYPQLNKALGHLYESKEKGKDNWYKSKHISIEEAMKNMNHH